MIGCYSDNDSSEDDECIDTDKMGDLDDDPNNNDDNTAEYCCL